MATATWVREELNRRGIAYQELQHPDAYTASEVAQKEHVSGHRVAKVVAAMADGRPIELILPASRRVDLDRVRELLNAREVRLASERELARHFTDCELGAVPAMRHWDNVEVMMDGQLCCGGDIYILGGTHRDALRMKFDDWFAMVSPRVESFTDPA